MTAPAAIEATIRAGTLADAEAIASIHNQRIAQRAATFDTDPVTAGDGWPGSATSAGRCSSQCWMGRAVGWTRVIRSGFLEVGVYERHGRLDGEWKDLLIVERLLGQAAPSM